MKLTKEQIRLLAKLEREMDAGIQPFVLFGKGRLAVNPDAMKEFDLEQGQTINLAIFNAIMEFEMRKCQVEIAAREFGKVPEGEDDGGK